MIPLDEELWKWNNYENFLEERRRLLIRRLRDLLE
jgi:hypothetical protein